MFMRNALKRLLLLTLGLSLLLGACMPLLPTSAPTQGLTEPPRPSVTIAATPTPTPVLPTPTPTRPLYMDIDPASLKGIQINLLHPWVADAEQIQALVQQFNQSNPWGIQVEVAYTGGMDAMLDVAQTQLVEHDLAEVMLMPPYLAERLDGDYLWLDLAAYVNDELWGLTLEETVDIPEDILKLNRSGDNLVGISILVSPFMLFYNRTWAKELGFTNTPTTYTALSEQLCAAAAFNLQDGTTETNGTGGLWLDNRAQAALSWYHAFGGSHPDQANLFEFNNDAGQASFEYVKTLYDSNCAWTGRQPTPYDYFATRLSLAYGGNLQDLALQEEAQQRAESTDEWLMLPYPSADGSGTLVLDGISAIITVDEPETQLAAWLFTKWLLSPVVQAQLVELTGYWPANLAALPELAAYRQAHPQWDDLFEAEPAVYAVPNAAHWNIARMVLEDAFSRSLLLDAELLPTVLEMMDETLLELSQMSFHD